MVAVDAVGQRVEAVHAIWQGVHAAAAVLRRRVVSVGARIVGRVAAAFRALLTEAVVVGVRVVRVGAAVAGGHVAVVHWAAVNRRRRLIGRLAGPVDVAQRAVC